MQALRSFLFSALVIAIVLGGFCLYAMYTGAWSGVVEVIRGTAGDEAAEVVESFGESSEQVAEGASTIDLSGLAEEAVAAAEAVQSAATTPASRIPDYDRDEFGAAWADVDGNSCDTRNDILARDLTEVVKKDACVVTSGVLLDPYTGTTISFVRGQSTSSAVQIDHIVPLSLAWRSGAWGWSDEDRMAFANDPSNLIATDGPTNSSKSDKGPSAWMPPSSAFTCEYSVRFSNVIDRYGLTLTDADRAALLDGLAACA